MLDPASSASHPVRLRERPPFERIALLLQGGGALGAYQAGVYQALAEANLHPDWVAGISIGGSELRLDCREPSGKAHGKAAGVLGSRQHPASGRPAPEVRRDYQRSCPTLHQSNPRAGNLFFGAPHFFSPRMLPPLLWQSERADAISYYDVAPLKSTLERLVDFDRINSDRMRFSVGAVNVRTGNFVYFDSHTHRISPAHVIASGSLPPGFPPTEIDGEYYWDGGLMSNTPLQWVLD
jgi:NTE family protein